MADDYAGNLEEKITGVVNAIIEKVGNVTDSVLDIAEKGTSGTGS